MRLLALEKELVQAFHAIDGVAAGQLIVESVPDQAEAVDRLVLVEKFLELVEQHIGESVLGEDCLVIERVQQAEQIVRAHLRADQAAQIVGAVRPGVSAGKEGGGAGGGEIAGRMVIVIDGRTGSQPLQVRAGLARVAIQRQVIRG